jgi:hypothetical protein
VTGAVQVREENVMRETIDSRDEHNGNCLERELTEEQFLEQFAELEESLALLQAQIHSMSERVKLFGSLAQRIRRSTCPAVDHRDTIRCPHAYARQ